MVMSMVMVTVVMMVTLGAGAATRGMYRFTLGAWVSLTAAVMNGSVYVSGVYFIFWLNKTFTLAI